MDELSQPILPHSLVLIPLRNQFTSICNLPNGGTVFALNTDGTGFQTLHTFLPISAYPYTNSDGAGPSGSLVLSGNKLYGTAANGGIWGHGTVFSLLLPATLPQLSVSASGQNVVLTWPTSAAAFTLHSTTNLASPLWTTNSLAPIVINGQNTVTHPISGSQQFFRLAQ